MDSENEDEALRPKIHPLNLFDLAQSQNRLLYTSAPMVRYSKLAFRRTVHHFGTDLCWTPMILAKEFNRNQVARDSDLTMSTAPIPAYDSASTPPLSVLAGGGKGEVPTIAQFGANDPTELSRAASLAAPFVNGVDLNCGCPQSWACASTLGAALMNHRELVRDMVTATRERLTRNGWDVTCPPNSNSNSNSNPNPDSDTQTTRGRSISVKIRVHKDLRQTMDFITTVLGTDPNRRNIDFLTIHPRTRNTPSSTPINLEALEILTSTFGKKVPILVSGDVFALSTLPYTSHLLDPQPTFTTSSPPNPTVDSNPGSKLSLDEIQKKLHLPNVAGLMSARALLANPALYAGHDSCPWTAVDVFMNEVSRAPLPLKLGVHHLTEMCGPGFGPGRDRGVALLSKRERARLTELGSWIDVIDLMDEVRSRNEGGEKGRGIVRFA
ncbi:FMN-linked oxidoreductase [Hypoxylon trugodes]|uniref:FMN-linked oxidoreductase n=1 Tax=Hypoxylon trugodes TaxID=326681 RepID=UPI00218E4E48|nr:FMN-linked oxidoreductase [Hypoxylon trugodes]KAI1386846.1 FMN-linked oxidoreductase [Hypoxylon trugodes]